MIAPARVFIIAIFLFVFATGFAAPVFTPVTLEGNTFIHDPSTIVKEGTNYFVFGTGRGVRRKFSSALIHWDEGRPVFSYPPDSVLKFDPDFHGSLWAPDIISLHGKFYLYYAVSKWGKQTSTINLVVGTTLLPTATNSWQDLGSVIASTNGGDFNAIDPSVMLDTDGKLWMSFGSYWNGVYLTELNPNTGLRVTANAPLYHLAWNRSIEASCITRHENFYYLFVNWGQCCEGTNSTYEVRVGRSEKIAGPYRDRDGNDLATGGGSIFLQSTGRFIGPGHIGILNDGSTNGPTIFSYHYYDADTHGRSRLAIGKIDWSSGWPMATN